MGPDLAIEDGALTVKAKGAGQPRTVALKLLTALSCSPAGPGEAGTVFLGTLSCLDSGGQEAHVGC